MSLVLSVVLTVALNVVIRLFPDASDRAASTSPRAAACRETATTDPAGSTHVIVPWKAMLIGSLLLTIVLSLLLRLG